MCLCDYVMHVKDGDRKVVYLDSEHSCILDKEDWTAVDHYEYAKSLFIYMNQAPFLDAVYTYREKCGTICK